MIPFQFIGGKRMLYICTVVVKPYFLGRLSFAEKPVSYTHLDVYKRQSLITNVIKQFPIVKNCNMNARLSYNDLYINYQELPKM